MSKLSKTAVSIALLLSSAARSDGIYPGGLGFKDGISNLGGVAVVIPGCSGTGLNFTVACNSQYIGII